MVHYIDFSQCVLVDLVKDLNFQPPEEAQFFAQLNLEEWREEENKFTQTLKAYMRKQFPKVWSLLWQLIICYTSESYCVYSYNFSLPDFQLVLYLLFLLTVFAIRM